MIEATLAVKELAPQLATQTARALPIPSPYRVEPPMPAIFTPRRFLGSFAPTIRGIDLRQDRLDGEVRSSDCARFGTQCRE